MPATANTFILALALGFAAGAASATGLATCESGLKSAWQPAEKLEKQLTEQGWKVRRIKEDGGCYEVYALDDKGQRVEAYFHPVTFEPVPTTKR
ncbi:MAG: PepSY domain-containing protein [Burkholderiaceae bacterium]